MKRDVSEKGDVLTRLEQERDRSDLAEQELSSLRVRFYELQQSHEEMQDKMKFFTKVSGKVSCGAFCASGHRGSTDAGSGDLIGCRSQLRTLSLAAEQSEPANESGR